MTPEQEKAALETLGEGEPGRFVFVIMQPSGNFMRCTWPAEHPRHVFGNDAGRADWVRAVAPPGWVVAISDMEIIFERVERAAPDAHQSPTPEVVLRAMLRAYTEAGLAAEVAYFAAGDNSAEERAAEGRMDMIDWGIAVVRERLARLLSRPDDLCDMGVVITADYKARLRGDRPLDALPLELHEVPTCSL